MTIDRKSAAREQVRSQTGTQSDMLAATMAAGSIGLVLQDLEAVAADGAHAGHADLQIPVTADSLTSVDAQAAGADVATALPESLAPVEASGAVPSQALPLEVPSQPQHSTPQSYAPHDNANEEIPNVSSVPHIDAPASSGLSTGSNGIVTQDQPRLSTTDGNIGETATSPLIPAPIESPTHIVDGALNYFIEAGSSAVQSLNETVSSGVASIVATVQDAGSVFTNAAASISERISEIENPASDVTQSLNGFASLLTSATPISIPEIAPSLLGAHSDLALSEEPAIESLAGNGGFDIPSLGFIGISYEQNDTGGLLHGFI